MVRSDLDEIFTGWKRYMKFSVNISKFLIICTLFNGIIFISSLVTVCICIMDNYIRKYIWVLLLTAGVMAYTIVTFFDHCAHAYFCIVHFFFSLKLCLTIFPVHTLFGYLLVMEKAKFHVVFVWECDLIFFFFVQNFLLFFLLLRILFRIATNIQFLFSIYLHNFFSVLRVGRMRRFYFIFFLSECNYWHCVIKSATFS